MKIRIKVKPGSKTESVEVGEVLVISVKEPAKDGRANRAVISLLARHFSVPQNKIRIVSGQSSKKKIVELLP